MAKIKFGELPKDMKISEEDMRRVKGGFFMGSRSLPFGGGPISRPGGLSPFSGRMTTFRPTPRGGAYW